VDLGRLVTARHGLDLQDAVRERHGGLDGVRQALAQVGPHHEPVDHARDVVLVALVEHDSTTGFAGGARVEEPDLPVDLGAREALGPQLLELLAVLTLAAAHDRREHHEPRALGRGHDLVDDLLGRLGRDRAAAVVAVGLADPRPQQAQVVVDLRDRADRRARVARRRLLVDRDRRRQALDGVDVRLVHLPEELTRVGAQRLDVAALPLRVDRVEGQRRLARSGQARDDDQRLPRELDGDVLEVVLAGAGDDDGRGGRGHLGSISLGGPRTASSNTRSPAEKWPQTPLKRRGAAQRTASGATSPASSSLARR
jgi:hypothetical protein